MEARKSQRGKGIRTAGKEHLSPSGADQITGIGNAHGTCGAGVDNIGDLAPRAQRIGSVAGNGGRGHVGDNLRFRFAGLLRRIIAVDARCTADATAQNHTRVA